MKKWIAIGVLTVLVSCMAVMSGCVSPDSSSPEPVTPTIPQTVQEPATVTSIPAAEIPVLSPAVPPAVVTAEGTTANPISTPAPVALPSSLIPSTGVWVKVAYTGNFSGSVGTPGVLKAVEGSGEHLYQISTIDGPVVATIQKTDGSSGELAVDVYKEGTLRRHGATTSPQGIIDIQASVKTETIPVTAVVTTNDNGTNEPQIVETPPQPVIPVEDTAAGKLFITIRAGGCGGDLKAFIAREGTEVSPIVYYYLPDKTVVEGQNIGYRSAKILMDGNSEMVELPPGRYTASLPPMNGGNEVEQQSFVINEGGTTHIYFAGMAATASARGCG